MSFTRSLGPESRPKTPGARRGQPAPQKTDSPTRTACGVHSKRSNQRHAGMTRAAKRCARKTIQLAAREMAQRMTGDKYNVSKVTFTSRTSEPTPTPKPSSKKKRGSHRAKESEKDDREVKKVTVQILQDERKPGLATVLTAGSLRSPRSPADRERTHGSMPCGSNSRWLEIPAARQNQQRRRKLPPVVMGVDQWRIKRREVRAPLIICALKGPPGCVCGKSTQHHPHRQNLGPRLARRRAVALNL